jgi:Na+/proline symporter
LRLAGLPGVPNVRVFPGGRMADAATTSSLATLDWIVVIGYLVVSIIIGAWSMRQITDAGAFLMARRKLGKLLSLSAAFAGNVNANDPITVTSKVYKDGISGIWSTLNFLLLTPWFWIRDPVGRRLRMVTGIDVWYHRFGPFLANFKLMTDILLGPINIGLGILAAAKVTLVVSGRHFVGPEGWLGMSQDTADMVLATGLVVVPTMIYTVMGGIIAAYATDVFMSVLIVVLSFVVVPYLWTSIGGAAAIGQCVPENHWELFATKTTADFSVIGIIWFCMVWIISLPPGPTGVKDEMTARIGGLGLILKRFCTLGWAAIGLFGLVYLVQQGRTEKPDDIFAIVSSELLPTGLRGVLVAAVLAAAMSTIASMAIGFAGVSLHNLYRPWFAPRASSGHYLFAVRVLSVVGLGLAWLVAVVNSQKPIFEYFTAMAILGASLGVPYLAAFLWRRVTTTGAIAAMIIGLITGVINLVSNDLSQPWWWGVDFIRQGWVA